MEKLMTLAHQFGVTAWIPRVVAAVAILIVGWIAIRFLSGVLRRIVARVVEEKRMAVGFVASATVKICWAFLAVIVLGKLGVNVGPIIAGLGVTGFVLGFAFQESLGSLASGLMIALNHPFKVGDRVTVGGFEGKVLRLDMMAVTLATADNKCVTIPNKSVWGGPIVNHTSLATA